MLSPLGLRAPGAWREGRGGGGSARILGVGRWVGWVGGWVVVVWVWVGGWVGGGLDHTARAPERHAGGRAVGWQLGSGRARPSAHPCLPRSSAAA